VFKRILIPLDGSELAEVALPYAEELSGRLGSESILAYVSESPDDPQRHVHQFYLEKMAETTKQGTEAYIEKSRKAAAIRVGSVVLFGNPAEEIIKYADKERTGLIIIATHGQSGIKQWALGSVADRIVRGAKVPVALIRAKGERSDLREIGLLKKAVVPLDGSKASERVIPYIEELASRLKAEVHLIEVLATGNPGLRRNGDYGYVVYTDHEMESRKNMALAYLKNVEIRLKEKGILVKTEVRSGDAAKEIIDYAKQIYADLVVMSTHGRSRIGRWVLGSVAESLLREGDTPLLLVRPS
jgi:nucleotide-binding universal stress UspA family protein